MNIFSVIKKTIIVILLLFFYFIFCSFFYSNQIFSGISNNIFRLHIIANSNSNEDQNLKYIVRDNILNYFNEITKHCKTKSEVIDIVTSNKKNIKKIAQNTVYQNGYNYNVDVIIGKTFFPIKIYGDSKFPCGYYDALKIQIGEASGKNWWCVLFPSLCFVDRDNPIISENSKEILNNALTDEEYNLILNNNYEIKFKIVEFFQNISTH